MMRGAWALVTVLLCVVLAGPLSGADPGISLVGMGLIPGNLTDLSGLAGTPICRRDDPADCRPRSAGSDRGSRIRATTTSSSQRRIAGRSTGAPTCPISIASI